jgi:hypothetical protein
VKSPSEILNRVTGGDVGLLKAIEEEIRLAEAEGEEYGLWDEETEDWVYFVNPHGR